MPVSQLIGRGIGFNPAGIVFIVTLGLSLSPPAPLRGPIVLDAPSFSYRVVDAGAANLVVSDGFNFDYLVPSVIDWGNNG